MNKKFLGSKIALAFILVAVFTGLGSGSAQRKTANSSAPPSDVLNYVPASDGIALIDVRRLMNETMPRILAGDPAKLARALITIASKEPPPRRFIAGADAIATAEQKVADLKAQIEAERDLSTSLDFDDADGVPAQ